MSTKWILKTPDGTFYTLGLITKVDTKDPKLATKFNTKEEAEYWRDHHSVFFTKIKDLGFNVESIEL